MLYYFSHYDIIRYYPPVLPLDKISSPRLYRQVRRGGYGGNLKKLRDIE
jgi:hypothetical protein